MHYRLTAAVSYQKHTGTRTSNGTSTRIITSTSNCTSTSNRRPVKHMQRKQTLKSPPLHLL